MLAYSGTRFAQADPPDPRVERDHARRRAWRVVTVRTNQYATDRSSRPVVNSLNESDPFSDRMKFFEELLGLLRDHRSPAPPELLRHQSRVAEPAEVHVKPGGLQHFRQVIGSAVRPPGSPGFACPFPLEVARPRTPQ